MTKLFIILTASLFLVAGQASADQIYKWIDKNGITHYSTNPPPPGAFLVSKTTQSDVWVNQPSNQTPQQPSSEPPPFDAPLFVPPPRISKADEAKCRGYLMGMPVDKKDAERLCENPDYVEPMMTSDFARCVNQIGSVTKNRYAEMLCYQVIKETTQALDQRTLKCLRDSASSAEIAFFFYEAALRLNLKNKIEYTVKDCLKGLDTRATAGQPTILNQFHFHTIHRRQSRSSDQLGGLSGIFWDREAQKYHLVSDNQRFPFMVAMTWNPLDPTSVPLLGNDTSIQKPEDRNYKDFDRFDYEEIVRLSNGNFVVSSEVDDQKPDEDIGGFFSLFKEKKKDKIEKLAKPLTEINKHGDVIREIPVADEIMPKNTTSNITYDCTPSIKTTDNDWRFDKNSMSVMTTTTTSTTTSSTTSSTLQKKVLCTSTETRRTQGFEPNKGIEALSYLEETQELFYGTEAPLIQDKGREKLEFVRIYRQTMGLEAKTQRYVKYPIKDQFNNGMPAMIALNANEMLILERGFDDIKKETHIKIFKINWNQRDADGYVVKKLVVSMNSLRNQMPAGFQRFDNLEGMTLGPETATHLTVVLVSDNNFSDSQVTQFVAVQIPKELLR